MFNVDTVNGKHYLIKNIINDAEQELDKLSSIYYICGSYQGARNEYAIIEVDQSKETIIIETKPIEQPVVEKQETKQEIIGPLGFTKEVAKKEIDYSTTDEVEDFLESLEKGKKKKKQVDVKPTKARKK